jgi:hypothetical protein
MAEFDFHISYCYKSHKYSQAVIQHVFRYLSATTGVKFYFDNQYPAIGNIADEKNIKFFIADENDAVAEIASRLSLSIKMGPFSNDRHQPANDRLLSEIISAFIGDLRKAGLIPERKPAISLWPDKYSFGLVVTHDVDILRRTLLGGLRLWVNGHLPGGVKAISDSLRWRLGLAQNPYNRFREWQKLEDELGLKSTYFIFAGNRQHNFDPVYKLSWLPFKSIPDRAIALHSSIGCYTGQGLCGPKGELELASKSKIIGIRPHYLSAYLPELWQAAYDSGFSYSSTLGFDDAIGFIRGIDLPFYPFDIVADKPIPILEIPIAIMDCGLIGNSDASSDDILSKGVELIDRVAQSGGLILLDWHQRTLYTCDYPGWGELFRNLIIKARNRNAHFTTVEKIEADMKSRIETGI